MSDLFNSYNLRNTKTLTKFILWVIKLKKHSIELYCKKFHWIKEIRLYIKTIISKNKHYLIFLNNFNKFWWFLHVYPLCVAFRYSLYIIILINLINLTSWCVEGKYLEMIRSLKESFNVVMVFWRLKSNLSVSVVNKKGKIDAQ